jgi:hypothetical protein
VVFGKHEDFGYHFGGFGIVIGERQKDAPAVL